MKKVLLSICISSYNHGDKCVQLVNRILSVQDDRYNIVICDDCSDVETMDQLQKISNKKVVLIRNKNNLGACKNWFKTIDGGTGTYALHVLDRDTININYLPLILDILEKNWVGGGYFGRSKQYPVDGIIREGIYAICKKGREAFLTMAGVPIHPTGFFVNKTIWDSECYKKFFVNSEKYGIYPHSYVLGELSIKNNMIYAPIPFYYYTYRGNNSISRFYDKSCKKEYWWLPDNVIKTANCLILYLSKAANKSYKQEFVCRRFKDALDRATLGYNAVAANQIEMGHYGFQAKYVSKWEMLRKSTKYRIISFYILNQLNITDKATRKQLQNIWIANLKTIVREIKEKNENRGLRCWNGSVMRAQVMTQWVNAKQERNNLSIYFKAKSYRRIAIYGMGQMGETLIEELKETDIEVVYGIDQKAEVTYSTIDVYSLNEPLPQVDVVVVTIVEAFDKIKEKLREKIKCPVISLMDVVYDI